MKLTCQLLLLLSLVVLILAEESTDKTDEESKTEPTPTDDDNDVTVKPLEKKKKKPKDKEEVTTKKPQREKPNFPPFQTFPDFYYGLNPSFIPSGPFINPYNGYPAIGPRFGGEFPGFPSIFPEPPKPKKGKPTKDKEEPESSKEDDEPKDKDEPEEKEESDNKEEVGRGKGKTDDERDSGEPRISVVRVLQLPVLLRGLGLWPRRILPPVETIPNTIALDSGFDGFQPRVGNPYLGYSGSPFLGSSFGPGFAPIRNTPEYFIGK